MNVHFDLKKYDAANAAVTIGSFDGLHKGHLEVLHHLKKHAETNGAQSVVISFWPHPRTVISGISHDFHLLTTLQEKIEHFNKARVDHLVFYPFTSELSKQTASQFFDKVLRQQIHTSHLLMGYNQRFGHDRIDKIDTLRHYAKQNGFTLSQYTAHTINELKLSSSNIRHLIEQGEISQANQLLGYQYSVSGNVVVGNKLGRTLGYPTANIGNIDSKKLLPLMGVYAVRVELEGAFYDGMLNIGFRPTVGGSLQTIEVNIFDFQQDIYGRKIRVYFQNRIRNEKKFASIDELKTQLYHDKLIAQQYLNGML